MISVESKVLCCFGLLWLVHLISNDAEVLWTFQFELGLHSTLLAFSLYFMLLFVPLVADFVIELGNCPMPSFFVVFKC